MILNFLWHKNHLLIFSTSEMVRPQLSSSYSGVFLRLWSDAIYAGNHPMLVLNRIFKAAWLKAGGWHLHLGVKPLHRAGISHEKCNEFLEESFQETESYLDTIAQFYLLEYNAAVAGQLQKLMSLGRYCGHL